MAAPKKRNSAREFFKKTVKPIRAGCGASSVERNGEEKTVDRNSEETAKSASSLLRPTPHALRPVSLEELATDEDGALDPESLQAMREMRRVNPRVSVEELAKMSPAAIGPGPKRPPGIVCPYCHCPHFEGGTTDVLKTLPRHGFIRRRRECRNPACGKTFFTEEKVAG